MQEFERDVMKQIEKATAVSHRRGRGRSGAIPEPMQAQVLPSTYAAEEPQPVPVPEEKMCKKCGQKLPLTDFDADKRSRDGLRRECKKCRAAIPAAHPRNVPRKSAQAPTPKNTPPAEVGNNPLAGVADAQLVAELRARGYEVEAVRRL